MATSTSIIIVNYKAEKETELLRHSLQGMKFAEVIVVDNSQENRGYGAGCNIGAAQAKGEYCLFLNPDVTITSDSIRTMVNVLRKHPEVGLVGPQILRPDGTIEISCSAIPTPLMALVEYSFLRKLPGLRWISQSYRLNGFDHRRSRSVPAIGGSCLALRRKDFQAIGGFDERLFLYFEEFDLAYRLRRALGKKTYFCAEAKITHAGQVSTAQNPQSTAAFLASRHYWLSKTYGWRGMFADNLLRFMELVHG